MFFIDIILFWPAEKFLYLYVIFLTMLDKIFNAYRHQLLGERFLYATCILKPRKRKPREVKELAQS